MSMETTIEQQETERREADAAECREFLQDALAALDRGDFRAALKDATGARAYLYDLAEEDPS